MNTPEISLATEVAINAKHKRVVCSRNMFEESMNYRKIMLNSRKFRFVYLKSKKRKVGKTNPIYRMSFQTFSRWDNLSKGE